MSTEPYLLPNGRVLRYSFRERLVHWLAGVSYVYLLLTGLAFWSPWLYWIAVVLGGATISRELHPWFGLVFLVGVSLMYRVWHRQMKETPADKAWWASIGHYIRNEDELVPPADRFNAGQKLLFWGFFYCSLLLLISGVILWFTELVPWNLHFLRYAAVLLHPAAALLTIGLFMLHIYMSVFAERGAFSAIIHGDVSEKFAKRYHPAWYEEVVRSSPARK